MIVLPVLLNTKNFNKLKGVSKEYIAVEMYEDTILTYGEFDDRNNLVRLTTSPVTKNVPIEVVSLPFFAYVKYGNCSHGAGVVNDERFCNIMKQLSNIYGERLSIITSSSGEVLVCSSDSAENVAKVVKCANSEILEEELILPVKIWQYR